MKRIMEQWRKFNEEEEERSELDKIKEIFVNDGVQAIELGMMLLPDSLEVESMSKLVESVRSFLGLIGEDPSPPIHERAAKSLSWEKEVVAMVNDIYYASSDKKGGFEQAIGGPGGNIVGRASRIGYVYESLEGIVGGGVLHQWIPHIAAMAEWAGVPMPKIPEEFSK